jgi:hypothetical protein
MPGKSDVWETDILNYAFRGVAMPTLTSNTAPASIWAALHSADPTDAGGGAELNYTSYARQAISRATGSWAAPADNSGSQRITNSNVISWPASTGGGSQTATHIGYWSAVTGGSLLYSEALTVAQTITVGGSAPSAAVGALTISEG